MNSRIIALSGVAVLLGGFVLVDQFGLPDLFSRSSGAAQAQDAQASTGSGVKINPLQGLEPQSFAVIMDRPLFNPSRAPRPPEPVAQPQPVVEQPVEQAPPPPTGPNPGDYKLLGIAKGSSGGTAAIKVAASGEVVYLHQGQPIDSWTVIDIGPRFVKIGTPENPVSFSLFEDPNADGAPMDGGNMGDGPPQADGMSAAPPENGGMAEPPPDGNSPAPPPVDQSGYDPAKEDINQLSGSGDGM